ncbi:MAG TPA: hypothetical protein VHW74_06340 [Mycobacteriales bacterium]|nr:hypothetical protein [Mycobacteriales bacterium]
MRNRTTTRRLLARTATVALGVTVPVLTAAVPAFALHRDDGGASHDPSLGVGLTLLYFVVIPVGAFLAIAAMCVLPSALSRPRYRPGKPWEFGARWFNGPQADGEAATAPSGRGGASAEW